MKRLITSAAVLALALSGALLGATAADAQAFTPPNGCIYIAPNGAVHGHVAYGIVPSVRPAAC